MTEGGLSILLSHDRARVRARLRALTDALHVSILDQHELAAASLTPDALASVARAQPAASRVRLVVIEDAGRLEPRCVEWLASQQALFAQTARVVLIADESAKAGRALAALLSQADVERLTGSSAEAGAAQRSAGTAFALADAITAGDCAGALGVVHAQLEAGKDVVELLGLVVWQLQRWVAVARLAEAGLPSERIATLVGMKPWVVQRIRLEVHGRSLASIQRGLAACGKLDEAIKTGRVIPRLGLEQVIAQLCVRADAPVAGSSAT